ncbi:MAG: DUF4245 domain-containing protein [Microbacteriaceae bacterium]|nr:DUF4245 domain-containing protein [Microbacteriaceae bacterium]
MPQPENTSIIPEELEKEPQNQEELAAYKLRNKIRRSQRQTYINLVLALLASVGVMLLLVFVVVRPQGNLVPQVDYKAIAATEQPALSTPLLVPDIPTDWYSNNARLKVGNADEVDVWQLGFVTSSETFIGIRQGIGGTDVWEVRTLDGALPTGSIDLSGTTWVLYDYRDKADEAGNYQFVISRDIGNSRVLIYGDAANADFEFIAKEVLK